MVDEILGSESSTAAAVEEMLLKHIRNFSQADCRKPCLAPFAQRCASLLALLAWLGSAAPSLAALGGVPASIEADRTHLAARASTIVNAAYTVQVITLPNGGTVKEFQRSDGVVFAIAWHGPSRPDLRQLLGSRFDVLQTDVAFARGGRRLRAPLADERSDFVLHSSGHSGAFVGIVYLPQFTPASVSIGALQ